MEAICSRLRERLGADHGEAIALRRELHGLAELGHEETGTAARIAAALGSDARPGPGTSVLAETGTRGPRVAIRAELDGLPIAEQTGVPWAAVTGRMHACGHDVHMAAALCVWRAAVALGEDLPFRLLLIFQPAEECYPSGAKLLVDEGLLSGVDSVVAAHVHPEIESGQVAVDPGPINAACANFTMVVQGRGGHVAYPERAQDPVPSLALLLGELTRLGCESGDGLVGIGVVECGESENIIPGSAVVRGTVRARSDRARTKLIAALGRIAGDTAAALGCPVDLNVEEGEPALVNDEEIVTATCSLLLSSGVEAAPPWRSFGADDFSYYGGELPVAMAFVGLRGMDGFAARPLHHPEFLPPDAAIARVAEALVCLACAAGSVVR
jgi:amidohydrolase